MENKEIEEQKTKMQEKQNLLNLVFAETFARHSSLTEEEFLKEIGFEETGMDEKKAVRVAIFNVCMELANQFMKARHTFTTAKNILKLHLNDESLTEEQEKGE